MIAQVPRAAYEEWPAGTDMPDTVSPDRIYFRFIRLQQRVFAEMAQTLKPTGLSIPQFDVLSTLTEQEGLSQSDLAQRLYVTKGNVSGLIDRLVEAGYVERRSAPGDRRSNAVFLTPAGKQVALDGIRLQKAFVADTLGRMSPDDLKRLDGAITGWRDAVKRRVDGT
jgi:MarR family transcriptional regulator, organic hydroperoxide resistance regulator